MNILRKDIDAVNAIVSVELTPEDYNEKVSKALKECKRRADFKGFRPGMAPMSLVKKMYGKAILVDELDKIVGEAFNNYIKDNNINVLGEPLPNETEQEELNFDVEGANYTFKFDIAIAPEVNGKITKRDKLPYYTIIVDDKVIAQQAEAIAQQNGENVPAEQIALRDFVKGNVKEMNNGEVDANGLQMNEVSLIPAYLKDEEIQTLFIDKKVGEKVVFNAAKAFNNENELARFLNVSKEEVGIYTNDFEFEVTQIMRYQPAAIDQKLFDKVFGEGNVKSEEEFNNRIKEEQIVPIYKEDAEYRLGIDAREHYIKRISDNDLPTEFLKRWLLHTNEKMTQEDIDNNFSEMLDGLKWQLIKDQIAKEYELKIEDEDIKKVARNVAAMRFRQYGISNPPAEIVNNYAEKMLEEKKPEDMRNLYEQAFEDKVIAIIKEKAALEEKEITFEDFNKLFEK